MFGALVYLILGSGKKQPWADGVAIRINVVEHRANPLA